MSNLEYFEKGLISAIEDYNEKYSSFMDGFLDAFTEIEDYNEKYSSFMDGFFDAFTEEDLIKLAALGMFPRLFSAAKNFAGNLIKKPSIRAAEKHVEYLKKLPIVGPYTKTNKETINSIAKTYYSHLDQPSLYTTIKNKVTGLKNKVIGLKNRVINKPTASPAPPASQGRGNKPVKNHFKTKSQAQSQSQPSQPGIIEKIKSYFFNNKSKTESSSIKNVNKQNQPKAQTKKHVRKPNPAEQKSSPILKGLGWGAAGFGAGVAATSAYNAYKNKNRDQQEEPYFYGS
jgi:hypothetical protein